MSLVRGVRSAGMCGGLGAIVDAELGEDGAEVMADGFGAEAQRGGDVGVAAAGGQLVEHFAFPDAELLRVGVAGAAG